MRRLYDLLLYVSRTPCEAKAPDSEVNSARVTGNGSAYNRTRASFSCTRNVRNRQTPNQENASWTIGSESALPHVMDAP